MEIDKQVDLQDSIGIINVFAKWTLFNVDYNSQLVSVIKGPGFLKIKLANDGGCFIFDKNAILLDPDFKIEFFLK